MSRSLLGLATKEQRPNLHYTIIEPQTGRTFPPNPTTGWRYSKEKMESLISTSSILFPSKSDGRPREKKFRSDMNSEFISFRSIIDGVYTADGSEAVKELFNANVFSYPKPVDLIRKIVAQVAESDDIVLDCFAGSGTTGHAVMASNSEDGSHRRYILVQLPEVLDSDSADQKLAADLCTTLGRPARISELTKERLRRASELFKKPSRKASADLGFRVFKLDSGNIEPWDPATKDVPSAIAKAVDNVKADRSDDDLVYDVLLKTGLDLCVPIESKKIAGKDVKSIGGGVLFTCFATKIKTADAEPLALGIVKWRDELAPANPKECRVVFRDSAFESDVAKSNLAAILKQHSFDEKLIASL